MRQYLVVGIGVVVLVVGLIAKSRLNKPTSAAAPQPGLVLAGQALTEALGKVTPAEHASLEPRFAAVAAACAGLGPSATAQEKRLCERADVLRQAAKSGISTPEGVRDVSQAMDALAGPAAPR